MAEGPPAASNTGPIPRSVPGCPVPHEQMLRHKVHMIEASATSVEMRTKIEQGKRVPRFSSSCQFFWSRENGSFLPFFEADEHSDMPGVRSQTWTDVFRDDFGTFHGTQGDTFGTRGPDR